MTKSLATRAILRANWNAQKDYLSNFDPFVHDVLRRWPPANKVDGNAVAERVRQEFGIDLPTAVAQTLVKRTKRLGYVHDVNRDLYVVPEKLEELIDLGGARKDAAREMNALVDKVIAHAADHGRTWSDTEAEAAVLLFLDEFGVEFATGKHGDSPDRPGKKTTEALSLVHSFARHAYERDPDALKLLEHAVKGSMLANVLYFDPAGSGSNSLNGLVVYLDTPIVIRALGISTPPLVDAAGEMLLLLKDAKVPVRIFEHTEQEIIGVLNAVSASLRQSRSSGPVHPSRLSRTNREVLDHFIAEKMTPGDVESVIADLEERLKRLGLQVVPTPEYTAKLGLDEVAFEESLQEGVGYQRKPTLQRDLDSLTAIHRLRKGRPARDLGKCQALFVTPNIPLARASRRFFSVAGLSTPVPHCMLEGEFVTQLWVRAPGKSPDLPRKALIADAYAALNPPAKLWNRYVDGIERLSEQGRITDEEVARLVFSTTARSALLDVTLGDADHVGDDSTIVEVLERADAALLDPVASEHQRALERQQQEFTASYTELEKNGQAAAEARTTELHARIIDLETELADKDARIADLADQTQRQRRLLLGYGSAATVVALCVALVVAGVADSGAAMVGTVSLAAGLAIFLVAAAHKGIHAGWKATVEIITVLGLIGVIAVGYDLLTSK